MQTATLKKVTEELQISLEDLVSYRLQGNKAFIEIDLKLPASAAADNAAPDVFDNILAMSEELGIKDWALRHEQRMKAQPDLAPEEELHLKYPNIKIRRLDLLKLVGCMTDASHVFDRDLIIDAIESKYGR